MAPSRGFGLILSRSLPSNLYAPKAYARRSISSFAERLSDPTNKVQSYLSLSRDPYLNLSIEDYILRNSPADSTVLFLYTNRPCIVIGRNQNPWSEANLGILRAAILDKKVPIETEPPAIGDVDLVRRRSGGGAVFHDEGNLNWSITCPRADFTRDKHAEMVVRALRSLGINRARVNERHDIVLDQGHKEQASDPQDTHRTPYITESSGLRPLKVSGSAYKLTRARALHHATTLLSSPNLHVIPQYLRSPAKAFIQAKGVESVSSPVGNIGIDIEEFQRHLQEEFSATYSSASRGMIAHTVGDEQLAISDIRKGYEELQSDDWIWAQTPQFSIQLQAFDGLEIDINVRHGKIQAVDAVERHYTSETLEKVRTALLEQKLQDIHDWKKFFQSRIQPWDGKCDTIADQLEELLPIPQLRRT